MAVIGLSCHFCRLHRDSAAARAHGGVRGVRVDSVGSLVGSPWIYAVVALSVLLDVFLPVLPSGVLVITAATAAAASTAAYVPDILVLTLCAATASVLGDLVAYRLAWRGGARLDRALARSRRLRAAQERLGAALARGGGGLVVLARFAPAPPATAPATSSPGPPWRASPGPATAWPSATSAASGSARRGWRRRSRWERCSRPARERGT